MAPRRPLSVRWSRETDRAGASGTPHSRLHDGDEQTDQEGRDVTGTAQPPDGHQDREAGRGDNDLDAERAEAAARLSELMGKLRDAQSRLDSMVSESRKLQEKLRQVRIDEEGGTANGA
jgi:hypothetical protein